VRWSPTSQGWGRFFWCCCISARPPRSLPRRLADP